MLQEWKKTVHVDTVNRNYFDLKIVIVSPEDSIASGEASMVRKSKLVFRSC